MSDGRGGNIKWFVGVHLFPNQANGKLVARNPGVLDFLGSPFLEGWNFLGEIPTEGPVVHHSLTRWWQLKYFLFSPLVGEMIQFDQKILQMGWFNHQPVDMWHLCHGGDFSFDLTATKVSSKDIAERTDSQAPWDNKKEVVFRWVKYPSISNLSHPKR